MATHHPRGARPAVIHLAPPMKLRRVKSTTSKHKQVNYKGTSLAPPIDFVASDYNNTAEVFLRTDDQLDNLPFPQHSVTSSGAPGHLEPFGISLKGPIRHLEKRSARHQTLLYRFSFPFSWIVIRYKVLELHARSTGCQRAEYIPVRSQATSTALSRGSWHNSRNKQTAISEKILRQRC